MVLFCWYLRPDLDMIFILVVCNNLLTRPLIIMAMSIKCLEMAISNTDQTLGRNSSQCYPRQKSIPSYMS